ncbi:MAG: hypothetical protein GF308_07480 [Candidatus Heimdallarchaeota archaeon]|nr:hypothetical protein [Candidatus Heimdallarchaeota archaeon]
MEKELTEGSYREYKTQESSPINSIQKIFEKTFNPTTEEIYWTHALKCVPRKSDKTIQKEWKMA